MWECMIYLWRGKKALYITPKEKKIYIYVNYLSDFRNLCDVLCSAASYFIPVLEDIPSGAKEDQEEARHHPTAAAWTKGHPQARDEKVVAFLLPSWFLLSQCQNPYLNLKRAIERATFRSCDKLEGLEG